MAATTSAVTFTQVTQFRAPDGAIVEFEPLARGAVPGFTHRVRVIRGGKLVGDDWLSATHRVGQRTARYFYENTQMAGHPPSWTRWGFSPFRQYPHGPRPGGSIFG